MSHTKRFEELSLIDDYRMNAVTADPEVGEDFCRKFLEALLQRRIGKLRVLTQRVILPSAPDRRGIRMDVEVDEELGNPANMPAMNLYDLEPHRKPVNESVEHFRKRDSLPRRNRFYQAKIDSRHLKSGERDFGRLPNLFVINVLDYDPFGHDRVLYTVRNQCEEVSELVYDDGLSFWYFNTTGTKGGNESIRKLLDFIQNSDEEHAVDGTTRQLLAYVEKVRRQPEVRDAYMTLDEIIANAQFDAVAEAMEKVKGEAERAVIINMQDNILELLEELGEVPEELVRRIRREERLDSLKICLKTAARAESLDEFDAAMRGEEE